MKTGLNDMWLLEICDLKGGKKIVYWTAFQFVLMHLERICVYLSMFDRFSMGVENPDLQPVW